MAGRRGGRQKSREAEGGRNLQNPPAQKKRGRTARVTRLPSRHVAQRPRRCQKNSARSRSCSAAQHTRARVAATHARAPARAVGRRNGGSNPQRLRSPQPKAFPTRNSFAYPEASLPLLLLLSPNRRPLLPVLNPPGLSNSVSPNQKCF